ncbi:hypothetical protein [Homoserinimonas hongtaonis]|uniref:Uncharacterized protein n=1 Tax=Homoserinimonas hongtaonis TaxID=2079791 RepID=A0A2U1T304_9MICO|nr:hypothetical protein [Salinibacterium hongtaonis]AWB88466.1 hypothetical protein C2138_01910 [Salinibacterium hongtaonis]PWB98246.1 hypothetical protein DF220_10720 [Salinibacterium hongtaonis]
MTARGLLAVAAAAAILALTGCASSAQQPGASTPPSASPTASEESSMESIADEVFTGLPEGVDTPADAGSGRPDAVWVEPGATFAIITWGSSTCPPVARTLEQIGDSEIAIQFDRNARTMCTMDFVPTSHVFSVPEGVVVPPLLITMTAEELDGPVEFELP